MSNKDSCVETDTQFTYIYVYAISYSTPMGLATVKFFRK